MSKRLGLTFVLLTAFIWAVYPFIFKSVLTQISPITVVGITNAASTISFLVISLAVDRKGFIDAVRGFRVLMLLGGIILAAHFIFFMIGLNFTTVVATSILILTESMYFVVWGFVFFREKVTGKKLLGLTFAVLGVFVVSWNGQDLSSLVSSKYFIGNVMILIAAFLFSFYMAFQKRLSDQGSGFTTLFPIFFIVSIITFSLAPKDEVIGIGPLNLGLIFLAGFLMALSYLFFAKSLEHIQSSTISVLLLMTPIIIVIIVSIGKAFNFFAGEQITLYILFGGAALIFGAFLVISEEEK